jgi:hypothetical protein
MRTQSNYGNEATIVLKEPAGWFVAGESFRLALTRLSDGAFKLFVYICLEANRKTGRYSSTQEELARRLGKSRRSVIKYIAELQCEAVCTVDPGTNQHSQTCFEIRDEFWPYRRIQHNNQSTEADDYVAAIRRSFLSLGCTRGTFSGADEETARMLKEQGIPLEIVHDALLVGAGRKYVSWLNGGSADAIGSLKYFISIVDEVRRQRISPDYRNYIEERVKSYAQRWNATKGRQQSVTGYEPDRDRSIAGFSRGVLSVVQAKNVPATKSNVNRSPGIAI